MLGGLITPGFFAPADLARFEFFGIPTDRCCSSSHAKFQS